MPKKKKSPISNLLIAIVTFSLLLLFVFIEKNYIPKRFSVGKLEMTYDNSWVKFDHSIANSCQQIEVEKITPAPLDQDLKDYLLQHVLGNSESLYNQLTRENLTVQNGYQIEDLDQSQYLILGPRGEGEIDNVYIWNPSEQALYRVTVWSNGPNSPKYCLEPARRTAYKSILSTIKFK